MAIARPKLGIERFRGLTRDQIRACIVIDERAFHVTAQIAAHGNDGVDTIVMAYRDADIPFPIDAMLEYAQAAEGVGMRGVAWAWYEVHAAAAHDRTKFRAFLVRNGYLEAAQKRFANLTRDEFRSIGDARASDRDSNVAVDAYRACGYLSGIRRILRRAIAHANLEFAEHAARALGRPLAQVEHEQLTRREIRSGHNWQAAFLHIRRYHLTKLHRPFIAAVTRDCFVPIGQICAWGQRIKCPPTRRDLERRLAKLRGPNESCHYRDAVLTAELLAAGSRHWRERRMPEIYVWARAVALGYHEAKRAEIYGQRIGRPLTVEELLTLAEAYRS
ncbi:hypothetical protein HY480_01765, partial [Candidatus Uhrbacteria bacterium]|nr:hypothetical protein [Candidatus Uhrbacteria bacterium]